MSTRPYELRVALTKLDNQATVIQSQLTKHAVDQEDPLPRLLVSVIDDNLFKIIEATTDDEIYASFWETPEQREQYSQAVEPLLVPRKVRLELASHDGPAAPKAAPPAAWLMMRSSSKPPSRPALAVREGGALGWRGWRTRTRPARR